MGVCRQRAASDIRILPRIFGKREYRPGMENKQGKQGGKILQGELESGYPVVS
jgi:hypothetical protein